jgi:transglutaminase-like putative cysteine protease/alkylated DNA nucleotide flippase Atl1
MRLLVPLGLLALAAGAARAQAPVVTPAGDPTVRNDTIYALAVDPASYPDQPFVYLLDDGIVRFEADGRAVRTYRQVVQVLTREAAAQWGEQTFSYAPSRERLRVNWVRVVRPDGSVVSDGPSAEQEADAVADEDSPVYVDRKTHRITLAGVAPGTLVDYSYTTETREPVRPGDFWSSWSIHTVRLVRRSRLILDVPARLVPRIHERYLTFARRETTSGGRHVYVWATQEVPRFEAEPFAVADSAGAMGLTISAPATWGDIAAWYAGLARDRYRVDTALTARLPQVVTGARTLADSVAAVYRWVTQDFRYVSLALGLGGYQPRLPAAVLQSGYGDCKDKATLFISVLQRFGVRAYPVLTSASGGVDRDQPSVSVFDHVIAAVERAGGGYTYADLTADLAPYGTVPPSLQGEFGLVVHPDGRGEAITFPADEPTSNATRIVIAGEIDTGGVFQGDLTETYRGSQQYSIRRDLLRPFTPTERDRVTRSIASGVFDGASGDSLTLFDGRDLSAEPRIRIVLRGGRAARASGDTRILSLPIGEYGNEALLAELVSRGARRYPIDAEAVFGPKELVSELRVRLPEGWRARLPDGVHAESPFGRYDAVYAQTGRDLLVRRAVSGVRGNRPAAAMDELIGWLRAMNGDDAKFIVVEHR